MFILTGQCLFSLGVIFRLQWSKDRRKLVSVSDDRTVRVWDVSIVGGGMQVTDILRILMLSPTSINYVRSRVIRKLFKRETPACNIRRRKV